MNFKKHRSAEFWGAKFKKDRISLGMTQTECAKQAGIHPNTLNTIEAGKQNYTITTFFNICAVIYGKTEIKVKIRKKKTKV